MITAKPSTTSMQGDRGFYWNEAGIGMMGSILVTGATGFIGSHLVRVLRQRGEDVIPHSGTRDGDLAHAELKTVEVAHVYHLAGKTFVPDSWADPGAFYRTNVLSTINLLQYCRLTRATMTLLSAYVYAEPPHLPISEDDPLGALNPYSHSKLLADETARFFAKSYGIPVTVVRPFNIYGPSQPLHFLVPMLIRQAVSPEYNQITVADDRPRRDFLFVDDLVDLLVAVLERRDQTAVYNAGSGQSISVRELADHICKVAGTLKPLISRGDARRNEVLDTVASIERARDRLGWCPKISLDDGLFRTIEWTRAQTAAPA
jgi:nucleoside-diphosphate-sugar epimerase